MIAAQIEPMHAAACDVRVEVYVLVGDEGDAGFTGEDALELLEAGHHTCPPLIDEDCLPVLFHAAPGRLASCLLRVRDETSKQWEVERSAVCGDASRGFWSLAALAIGNK